MNGHFSAVGDEPAATYEHGVQVIDEDKEFKYALAAESPACVHG
jgi:hypothetical protein